MDCYYRCLILSLVYVWFSFVLGMVVNHISLKQEKINTKDKTEAQNCVLGYHLLKTEIT